MNIDPSKQVKVVNQSGVAVSLLVPVADWGLDQSGGTRVYATNLEFLRTIQGAACVQNGQSGTYLLNQYFQDPDSKLPVYVPMYDLLLCTETWLTPIANMSASQSFDDPPLFPDQVVRPDQRAALSNATLFYQTISAYPTSQLAQDFQAALKNTNAAAAQAADGSKDSSARTADAISGGIDGFFKQTRSFQNVTMADYVAISSYYEDLPFVWAGYGDQTYYLYSSDGKTTSFTGTLALKKPAKLDIALPNAGYTCTFTPAKDPSDTNSAAVDSGKQVSLTYQQGLFVDSTDSDTPQIAIRGSFYLKRFFTRTPSDTKIVTVLSGAANGAICIGFNAQQKKDDKESSEFWDSLFHPRNSAQIFKSVMTLGGALMMVMFLGAPLFRLIWGAVKTRIWGKEPTTRDMLNELKSGLEDSMQSKMDAMYRKMSDGSAKAPENASQAQDAIESARSRVNDNLDAGKLQDALASQESSLKSMAQYESQMNAEQMEALQGNVIELRQIKSTLDNADADSLREVVEQQGKTIEALQGKVNDLSSKLQDVLEQNTQETIAENAKSVAEAQQDIEDGAKNEAEEGTSDDPVIEDPVVP